MALLVFVGVLGMPRHVLQIVGGRCRQNRVQGTPSWSAESGMLKLTRVKIL